MPATKSKTYERARDAAGLTSVGEAADAFVEERVEDSSFEPLMRTKLRWLYVSGKIEMIQRKGEAVPDALWDKHDALHAELMDADIRPSELLAN
jgi:hypothetical protein